MAINATQAILDQSKCWTQCATEKQLLGALAYLTGQVLLVLDPMADVNLQSVLDASRCWTQCATGKQLLGMQAYLQFVIENGGGGGGGGGVALLGENYCFTGTNPNQILKIGNITTGSANRVDIKFDDPDQTLLISDKSSC